MANRLPAEIHLIHGTKAEHKAKPLPDKVRARVPVADWLDDPAKWDRAKFIRETSDFLWETYGIGSDQDKHVLSALASQLEIFVRCWQEVQGGELVLVHTNGTVGPNPHYPIMDKALSRAVVLMNELGLTPRGRLAKGNPEAGKYTDVLTGP